MSDDTTPSISCAEAGRRGGTTTRDTAPKGFYQRIGAKGGQKVAERGPEHYSNIGRAGAKANMALRDAEYWITLGKKGAKARARNARIRVLAEVATVLDGCATIHEAQQKICDLLSSGER